MNVRFMRALSGSLATSVRIRAVFTGMIAPESSWMLVP